MITTCQLVVVIHYVPLSANELEERRTRLRSLLLRGALRSVQHQDPAESAATEDPLVILAPE